MDDRQLLDRAKELYIEAFTDADLATHCVGEIVQMSVAVDGTVSLSGANRDFLASTAIPRLEALLRRRERMLFTPPLSKLTEQTL